MKAILLPAVKQTGGKGETGKQRPWCHPKVSSRVTSRQRNTKWKVEAGRYSQTRAATLERGNGRMAGVVDRGTDDIGEL